MGKSRYIEYDYESVYDKYIKDLPEEKIIRMLRDGKIRSLYATKEIRAGDLLDVEIYPEFTRKQKKDREIIDQVKKEKQKAAQEKLNAKNSEKRCERLINENFDTGDIWETLTYGKGQEPKDLKEAKKNIKNYIERLNYYRKKEGLPLLRYVCTAECGEKGRWHHHIVMDGDMPMDLVESKWKHGRRNQVRHLEKDENGLSGMGHYISKQKKNRSDGSKYQKVWTASKNLRKPQIRKNHYKFRKKDVNQMVEGKVDVADKMAKWYAADGYRLLRYEIRYNEMNGRFYISARLNRPPRGGANAGKNRKNVRKNSEGAG